MKIIPKHQKGGNLDAFFTTYVPVQIQEPSQVSTKQRSTRESEDTLTEKDFFNMLKDVNGLPSDMDVIVNNLVNTFQYQNLTGINVGNLSTMYLRSLSQIVEANQNYDEYKEAMKRATTNGALSEPAISPDGRLVAQDNEGKLTFLTLDQYYSNTDNYHLLSVSSLASMRKYEPALAYNQEVLNIINNSTGYEEFQNLIEKAKNTLGSSKYTETSSTTLRAIEGLQQIENLSDEDKSNLLLDLKGGTVKYSTESNINQIKSLFRYISNTIPDRVKVWAAIKLGTSNKQEAVNTLIEDYLLGSYSNSTLVQNTESTKTKSSNSSGGSDSSTATNPNMGFWAQTVAGIGGEDASFNIVSQDVGINAPGKYWGTTPGLDNYKSLNQYIIDSDSGYIIKNRNNITFGDNKLVSGDDIVIDPNAGAYVVSLPITSDGRVNFSVLDEYNRITNELISKGYKIDSNEYNLVLAKELEENGMGYLVEGTIPNPRMFGYFLILQGIGSDKTQIEKGNQKTTLKDSNSHYIVDSSEEDQLYDIIKQALSTEDSEYELDNNWVNFGPFSNDKVYRGNIFIPITSNPNSAMIADNNDIRRNKAYEFEEDYQTVQRRRKLNELQSTSTNNL